MCTLCFTRLRILRTERGDEDAIGIREERVRELFLYMSEVSVSRSLSLSWLPCLKLPFLLSLG